MDSITLKRDGLDESINSLEQGETMEIHGTFTVISKSDTEIVGELTDVKKCGHMGEDEYELDDEEGEDEGGEDESGEYGGQPKGKPMMHGKKGMGILIMIGGPKKK
jgi:hypothetical protein